ncbi:hypothetical protein AGMMS50268_37180 [Spirochaetia bacterium]|nr:hypothetical protein AGMMS50268_37180 [Spirochaetia bacterium]
MHRYSEKEIKFLEKKIKGRTIGELAALFNQRFGLEQTEAAIRFITSDRGFSNGAPPPHNYSAKEIRFLEKHAEGQSFIELAELFNKHFDLRLEHSAIRAACHNRGITNGLDYRFQAGFEPWNKGLKGWSAPGTEKTRFKPGNIPANYMPVGSERINSDGYVDVKIADPNKWKQKHLIIWEKANGPVPKGHVIIFTDKNKLNIKLKNLLMVSRAELAIMNHIGLIFENAELTKTGKLIADVNLGIADRKRGARHRKARRRAK